MKIQFKLTKRQTEAFDFLVDKVTKYILYGGAKGGGKSWLLCIWVVLYCKFLCDLFGLKPSDNPIALGFIGRKIASDFKKTTLETWKKVIPADIYEIRKQDGEIILFNGSCKIFFGGLDSRETINKFNSAELAFFALDQAEETEREDVSVLRGSLRLMYNGIKPVYKELYTANPADCWLKADFIDSPTDKHRYIPALPTDNPHLPDDYIETLEEAFKYNLPLLRAYRDGDWHSLKASNSLYNDEMLNNLKHSLSVFVEEKRVVACDPATSHDECVIYAIKNAKVIDATYLPTVENEMIIAGHIMTMASKHSINDAIVDSIGLGAGICGRLEEMNTLKVIRFNSSETKNVPEKYANRRAEMHWEMMKKVQDKKIPFIEDEQTKRQLKAIKFKVVNSNGKIQIIDKGVIKRESGVGQDRSDCLSMGIYAMDRIDPWKDKKDRYSFNNEQATRTINHMVV